MRTKKLRALGLIIFLFSAPLLACPNFTGEWLGECEGLDGLKVPLSISQAECQYIVMKFPNKTDRAYIGNIYSNAISASVNDTTSNTNSYVYVFEQESLVKYTTNLLTITENGRIQAAADASRRTFSFGPNETLIEETGRPNDYCTYKRKE